MKRRDFIKYLSVASGSLMIPNMAHALMQSQGKSLNGKKLVIIQLAGGNDGLNTIIPYRNDIYYKNRPTISISPSNILKINDELGFNNQMTPLKNIYDKAYLSIINNVGYPHPNRSHFRSTDIWHTASGANEYLHTGWLGRYIDIYGKTPYSGIELDDSLSLIMKGNTMNGMATTNPKLLYGTTRTPFFKELLAYQPTISNPENNLDYLYQRMQEASSSAKYIFETSKNYKSSSNYPKNPFGKQLKTTAKFINSGLNTEVYFISMGGFDTHANQLKKQNNLLEIYSKSIEVFINELEENDTFKDTLILTFSEFGRRVKQNAANGTDHGAANNVFIIGKNLKKGGVYNKSDNLEDLDENGDLKYSIDFRSIYSTIMENWMGIKANAIIDGAYPKLNFV